MSLQPDLDIIDDPYRRCEVDDLRYHEDFGASCDECDIWICNNCWPEHIEQTGHVKRLAASAPAREEPPK